jgi:hypothetical protein
MATIGDTMTWTDERIDDLAKKVDDGFEKVDAEIGVLRADVISGFLRVNDRIDRMNHILVGGLFAVVAVLFGAQVA